MKSTIAKSFVDTNVFVYARDRSLPQKQVRAVDLISGLWRTERLVISTQVITEFCAVLTGRYQVEQATVIAEAKRLLELRPVPMEDVLLRQGFLLRLQYQLSWWDAWIVAAAMVAKCDTIYSEDLADGASYHGVVVRNPFN